MLRALVALLYLEVTKTKEAVTWSIVGPLRVILEDGVFFSRFCLFVWVFLFPFSFLQGRSGGPEFTPLSDLLRWHFSRNNLIPR